MRSLDVANHMVARYGNDTRLTNLSLNKLVYFAQVESLRKLGRPLFSDPIQAWEYGPVEPLVYHAFKDHGRSAVTKQAGRGAKPDGAEAEVIDGVMDTYGHLTAYDLVSLSHKEGGAWQKRYVPGKDAEIRTVDIIESSDYQEEPDLGSTLSASIRNVRRDWANTLQLLADA